MALLDILGSAGAATAEFLPRIQKRQKIEGQKRINSQFRMEMEAAVQMGDFDRADTIMQNPKYGAVTPTVMEAANKGYNDAKKANEDKTLEGYESEYNRATTPEQKMFARNKIFDYTNPDATPEEITNQRNRSTEAKELGANILQQKNETLELKKETAKHTLIKSRIDAEEAQRIQDAQKLINEAIQNGDNETAATIATNAGMTATAKSLKGETWALKDKVSAESSLRKDYAAANKTFISVRDSYSRILVVGSNPSAFGDMALIFNFMKMLDPGSTVRESEFRSAENSGAIPERVWNMYNKLLRGEKLGPKDSSVMRDDLLNQAGNLYASQLGTHRGSVEVYTGIADRSKLDVRNIAYDMEQTDFVDSLRKGDFNSENVIFKNIQEALDNQGNRGGWGQGQPPPGQPEGQRQPPPGQPEGQQEVGSTYGTMTDEQKKALMDEMGVTFDPETGLYR